MAFGKNHAQKDGEEVHVESVINTLQRCLQIASTSTATKIVPASSPAVVAEKAESCTAQDKMPDGSQWPHCQHAISQDDPKSSNSQQNIKLVQYQDETQIGAVMRLMTKDLSEPYSIYTYRFFVHNWPELCILAIDSSETCVGAVVGKLEQQSDGRRRGYIAMLAVDESCRRMGLATRLVRSAIENMLAQGCDEVYLETEVENKTAQRLYTKLGFIRDKRLLRYYLNGNDAFRLKLFFTPPSLNPVPDYC